MGTYKDNVNNCQYPTNEWFVNPIHQFKVIVLPILKSTQCHRFYGIKANHDEVSTFRYKNHH